VTFKWQVGAVIQAGPRGAHAVKIAIPILNEWPEQSITLIEEDISSSLRNVKYETIDGDIQRVTASVPKIGGNGGVKLLLKYDVEVRPIAPPEKPHELMIPERPDREIKRYLNSSPLINHRRSSIRRLAESLAEPDEIQSNRDPDSAADSENASDREAAEVESPPASTWSQIESFYNWIRENIRKTDTDEVEGASATLRNQAGNGEDLTNLFIAMCRAHRVPARMVWADGMVYAEFYLENDQETGDWYPCQLDNRFEFGRMTTPRVITQKGDNIKVPGVKGRRRYVRELVTGSTRSGGAHPQVTFVRQTVPE